MAIEIALTGTRADLAAHLTAKAADHRNIARKMSKEAAAQHIGQAEGLEEAASDLERWVDTSRPAGDRAMGAGHLRPLERDGVAGAL